MRRWFDLDWYRYLRHRAELRLGPDRLFALGVLALGALLVGGYLTFDRLESRSAASDRHVTLTRLARASEHGRVRLVQRVAASPVTVIETRTVATGGVTVSAPRPVVRVQTPPFTVDQVVTHTRTLTATQPPRVTTTPATARTTTVLQSQTVTRTETQIVTRTESAPTRTVTVRDPGGTVTVTSVTTTTASTGATAVPQTVTVTRPGRTATSTGGDGD